jgi:hypothetical protein
MKIAAFAALSIALAACSTSRPTTTSTSPSTSPSPSTSTSPSTTPSTSPSTDLDASPAVDLDASTDAAADAAFHPHACLIDMVLVDGEYCTALQQDCLVWMEPPAGDVGRCKTFAPSVCHGARVHKHFCIDIDEFTRPGQKLPVSQLSWTEAKKECEKLEKRLCLESEWNFACEGEAMLPYPTGLERPAKQCNFDQMKLLDAHGSTRDLRVASASLTECVSPFGARSMVGNVDEWTFRDVMNGPNRTALKGGWWMAARNRCRPATTAHSEVYRDFQTGFRCCADGW